MALRGVARWVCGVVEGGVVTLVRRMIWVSGLVRPIAVVVDKSWDCDT